MKKETKEKFFLLPDELEKFLREHNAFIEPIGPFQLQAWVDWLIMNTQRKIKEEDVINAVKNFKENWGW